MYKMHVALSLYPVREAIIAKIIRHYFVLREINPADILSKR